MRTLPSGHETSSSSLHQSLSVVRHRPLTFHIFIISSETPGSKLTPPRWSTVLHTSFFPKLQLCTRITVLHVVLETSVDIFNFGIWPKVCSGTQVSDLGPTWSSWRSCISLGFSISRDEGCRTIKTLQQGYTKVKAVYNHGRIHLESSITIATYVAFVVSSLTLSMLVVNSKWLCLQYRTRPARTSVLSGQTLYSKLLKFTFSA